MVCEYGINLRRSRANIPPSTQEKFEVPALWKNTYCKINFWSSTQSYRHQHFLGTSHWKQHTRGSLPFIPIRKEQAEIQDLAWGNATTCVSLSLFSIPVAASDSPSDGSSPSHYSICAAFYLGSHWKPVSFTVQSDHQQTLENNSRTWPSH